RRERIEVRREAWDLREQRIERRRLRGELLLVFRVVVERSDDVGTKRIDDDEEHVVPVLRRLLRADLRVAPQRERKPHLTFRFGWRRGPRVTLLPRRMPAWLRRRLVG